MIAEIHLNNIPGELRGIHQWVLWKTVERDGKRTKMPYNRNGAPAKSNDPATWGSFDEVYTKYERGGFDGLGFVFSESDDYFGIDLDACRNPETGELTDWASEIVAAVNSYVEVSPSGTGIKLVARGKLPGGKGRVKKLKDVPTFGDKEPEIAFYDCGRYWCMTGQRLPGARLCCEPRQEQLDVLLAKLFQGSRHGGDRKSKSSRCTFEKYSRNISKYGLVRAIIGRMSESAERRPQRARFCIVRSGGRARIHSG